MRRICLLLLLMWDVVGDHFMAGQRGLPNHNPLFRSGPDITVVEGQGVWGAQQWCFDPVDGDGPLDMNNRPTNSRQQSLTFEVIAADPSLFTTNGEPRIDDNCQLTFEIRDKTCGSTTVSVVLSDDGNPNCVDGLPSSGVLFICPGACTPADCSKSAPVDFSIDIICCNDPPFFSNVGSVIYPEDSPLIQHRDWAFSISPGGTDVFETSQMLTFIAEVVQSSNPLLFSTAPRITTNQNMGNTNPSGFTADLVFEPAPGQCGIATIEAWVIDDGGSVNGCQMMSIPPKKSIFTIEITCDNDNPQFTPTPGCIIIGEDHFLLSSGPGIQPFSQPSWATDISAGDQIGTREMQNLRFELVFATPGDEILFLNTPEIDSTGRLTFQLNENSNTFATGDVNLYVRLRDDGNPTAFSCEPITSCPVLCIRVNPINDPPSATCGPNVVVCESSGVFSDGNNWAKNLMVGPPGSREGICPGCEGQEIFFDVQITPTGGHDLFVNNRVIITGDGTLQFELLPNVVGTAQVTARVLDTGEMGPPGSNEGPTCSFFIAVTESKTDISYQITHQSGVNSIIVDEDDPPALTDYPGFLFNIQAVGGGIAPPNLIFRVESDNDILFTIPPHIQRTSTETARLLFELAPDQCGVANLLIYVSEDQETSCPSQATVPQQSQIIVNCVNDPPPDFLLAACPYCCSPSRTSVGTTRPSMYSCNNKMCTLELCESETVNGVQGSGFVLSRFVVMGENTNRLNLPGEENENIAYQVGIVSGGELFDSQPIITPQGELQFSTLQGQFGNAVLSITAVDDGTPPQRSTTLFFMLRIHQNIIDLPQYNIPNPNVYSGANAIPACQRTSFNLQTCEQITNTISDDCPYISPLFTQLVNPNEVSRVRYDVSWPIEFNRLFTDTGTPSISAAGTLGFELRNNALDSTLDRALIPITVRSVFIDSVNGGRCEFVNVNGATSVRNFNIQIERNPSASACLQCGAIFENRVVRTTSTSLTPSTVLGFVKTNVDPSLYSSTTFSLITSNRDLFIDQPIISNSDASFGSLMYTARQGVCGSTTVNLNMQTVNPFGRILYNVNCVFSIIIEPLRSVGNLPTFEVNSNMIEVNEDSGETCVRWVTQRSPFSDCTIILQGQSMSEIGFVTTANDNLELFRFTPVVTAAGDVCFTPESNLCGFATVSVAARNLDNGGLSVPRLLDIKVNCVNDPPTAFLSSEIRALQTSTGNEIQLCKRDPVTYIPYCDRRTISAGPVVNEDCPGHIYEQHAAYNVDVLLHDSGFDRLFFTDSPVVSNDCTLSLNPNSLSPGSEVNISIQLCDDGARGAPHQNCATPDVYLVRYSDFTANSNISGSNITLSSVSDALVVSDNVLSFYIPNWVSISLNDTSLSGPVTITASNPMLLNIIIVNGKDLSFQIANLPSVNATSVIATFDATVCLQNLRCTYDTLCSTHNITVTNNASTAVVEQYICAQNQFIYSEDSGSITIQRVITPVRHTSISDYWNGLPIQPNAVIVEALLVNTFFRSDPVFRYDAVDRVFDLEFETNLDSFGNFTAQLFGCNITVRVLPVRDPPTFLHSNQTIILYGGETFIGSWAANIEADSNSAADPVFELTLDPRTELLLSNSTPPMLYNNGTLQLVSNSAGIEGNGSIFVVLYDGDDRLVHSAVSIINIIVRNTTTETQSVINVTDSVIVIQLNYSSPLPVCYNQSDWLISGTPVSVEHVGQEIISKSVLIDSQGSKNLCITPSGIVGTGQVSLSGTILPNNELNRAVIQIQVLPANPLDIVLELETRLLRVYEDTGPFTSRFFVRNIEDFGNVREQFHVRPIAANWRPEMFIAMPGLIRTTGDLVFTVAKDINGLFGFEIMFSYENDTQRLVRFTNPQLFSIDVISVNDQPVVALSLNEIFIPPQNIYNIDSVTPSYSLSGFLSRLLPGPTNENSQSITSTTLTTLSGPIHVFRTLPMVHVSTGALSFVLESKSIVVSEYLYSQNSVRYIEQLNQKIPFQFLLQVNDSGSTLFGGNNSAMISFSLYLDFSGWVNLIPEELKFTTATSTVVIPYTTVDKIEVITNIILWSSPVVRLFDIRCDGNYSNFLRGDPSISDNKKDLIAHQIANQFGSTSCTINALSDTNIRSLQQDTIRITVLNPDEPLSGNIVSVVMWKSAFDLVNSGSLIESSLRINSSRYQVQIIGNNDGILALCIEVRIVFIPSSQSPAATVLADRVLLEGFPPHSLSQFLISDLSRTRLALPPECTVMRSPEPYDYTWVYIVGAVLVGSLLLIFAISWFIITRQNKKHKKEIQTENLTDQQTAKKQQQQQQHQQNPLNEFYNG